MTEGVLPAKGAIRARFWLHLISPSDGKGCGVCSDWCALDAADGLELDICGLRDWQRGLGSEATVLAFLGVEVSEKRGRHWVRLPFACGLRVLGEVVLARTGWWYRWARLRRLLAKPPAAWMQSLKRHSRRRAASSMSAAELRDWPEPGVERGQI